MSKTTSFTEVDGITYTDDMHTLVRCDMKKTGEIVIPEGVRTIQERAFFMCTKITSVIMPDSLKTIQPEAFNACYNLKHVDFGHGIKELGFGIFYNDTFEDCIELRFISIPPQVKKIGVSFFANSGLTKVELNEGLEEIEYNAFSRCPLSKISLPKSLKYFGNQIGDWIDEITLNSIPENFIYTFVGLPDDFGTLNRMLTLNLNNRKIFLPTKMSEEDRKQINEIFNAGEINDELIYHMYERAVTFKLTLEIGSYIYNDALKRNQANKLPKLKEIIKSNAFYLVAELLEKKKIEDTIMVINFGFLTMADIQVLLESVSDLTIRAYLLANISASDNHTPTNFKV